MELETKKTQNSVISWGQLIIILGTLFCFLFALTQRVNFERTNNNFVLLDDYQFNSGSITKYTGTDEIVEIPSSYSLGPTKTVTGSVTFRYEYEAFDFFIENYATGSEGYYDFYRELLTHEYPWKYDYSIEKHSYIVGKDIAVNSISEKVFQDNKTIKKVIIPSSIESIGNFAFQNCSNLTEVIIDEGLTFIGDSTFWGCPFTSIKLPDSLKTIYPYAFFRCSNLKEITIPKNVEKMLIGTFNACTSLKKATFITKTKINTNGTSVYHTFSNCTSLEEIYVPAENLEFFKTTYPWNLYEEKYKAY